MTENHYIRKRIAEAGRTISEEGMVTGTSGNISIRYPERAARFGISPAMMDYDRIAPSDVPILDFDGEVLAGDHDPSIEWQMHRNVYERRDDVGAVVHTHCEYATALAAVETPIPPFLDEITMSTGGTVEVAEYAPSGSEVLADHVADALGEKNAVLLSQHGLLCCGTTLEKALETTRKVDRAAKIYILANSVGDPESIPEDVLELQKAAF
jgi:L-fuculose-phosphate aldolase